MRAYAHAHTNLRTQSKKNKPYLMVRNSWGVRKKMKEGVGEKSAAAHLRKKQQRGSGGGKHNG